ncbi:hypothetical protein PAHAL_5G455900 [Panicum hallii]|uniref:RING-type E3 ubiquitin transferase n=2 Tax=Panicum hallii TaxID=206008 RepID=A0A2S3HXJ0_9POAL|nr:hypothetical protein PAHAL_5G455900 [Panicum hallii]
MDGGSTESGFPEWDWLSSSSSGLPPAFPGSSLPTSGEPSPMENGERSSAKRVRVPSPPGNRVKQEVPAWEEEASGGGETEAMDGAAARAEVVVRIDKEMLHCPICTLPLKPPIFQCGVGHTACGSCHGQLPTNQCHSCDGGGGGLYGPCPVMDALVAKAVVPCPHQAYGCRASVAYYQASEHGSTCPHAPCACGEPGCAFVGSPPALLAHLAAAPHSWAVENFRYGETLRLSVPEPEARRLLVADGDDGSRRVFVLAVGDRASRTVPVSVACVRAPGAAAAGPQYTCKMWATGDKAPATGKVESVLVDMEVPSAAAAGAVAADDEKATFLGVPRKMLRGASRQMLLSVRIGRASG